MISRQLNRRLFAICRSGWQEGEQDATDLRPRLERHQYTNTYGQLPEALVQCATNYNLNLNIQHIWLGKYVSFNDEVTLDDIAHGFYPFVLSGQGIDHKFYDFLNNYLKEPGSDGVVRVAGANMNYRFLSLVQSDHPIRSRSKTLRLEPQPVRTPKPVPLGVYRDYSHSGKDMGIMFSIKQAEGDRQPVVRDILKSLQVEDNNAYQQRFEDLKKLTEEQQTLDIKEKQRGRYAMLVFHVKDDQGSNFERDDFENLLLTGADYQPRRMPDGFLKDKQMNATTHNLVLYIDCEKIAKIKDGRFGIRVTARPAKGFAYYAAGEYHSDGVKLSDVLVANQTTYVDVYLKRNVDKNVFRFDRGDVKRGSFKKLKPVGGAD